MRAQNLRPVVVRHPMPYGDLSQQAVQRFATVEDCDRQHCTIEEREEYEQHIAEGVVIYAGVDYAKILEAAEKEADILLWDGGNNDWSFLKPDLEIVLVDPHRPGHELLYHPGETNLRRAQVHRREQTRFRPGRRCAASHGKHRASKPESDRDPGALDHNRGQTRSRAGQKGPGHRRRPDPDSR